MRASVVLLLAAAVARLAPFAAAQEPTGEWSPPKYTFARHDEDWSGLRGREREPDGGRLEPWKLVPLDERGEVWASFGLDAWVRVEAWRGFNFGAPPGADADDSFLLTRLFAHGDLHFGRELRFFVQGRTAHAHSRDLVGGDRPVDEDPLDLQQGFVDLAPPIGGEHPLTLRTGRQLLSFGKQRLVSPLPWVNVPRAFDGASAIWTAATWKTTAFWSRPVEVDQHGFNPSDSQNALLGLYAACAPAARGIGLELYWLGLRRDDALVNGTAGDETRHSLGGRSWGPLGGGFRYEVEGTYQLGDLGGEDISAFMVATELAHAWDDHPALPRAWLGFDYASGDRAPGGSVGTFNQLFPLGHAYYGYADVLGRQNALDSSLGAELSVRAWRTALVGHLFRAARTGDALYNVAGAPFRAAGSFQSREIGYELDLTATRRLGRHFTALLGYSRFSTGAALEQSGPSRDVDFGYLSLAYAF